MGLLSFLFGKRSDKGASDGDGSTPARAIVVASVEEEYQWIQRHCPGFQPQQQTLAHIDGKPFDVLELRNQAGKTRTVFFDISQFFG